MIRNEVWLFNSWTGKKEITAYPDSLNLREMLDMSKNLWSKRNKNHKVVLKINGKTQQTYPAQV
jgi:hypothetical protein